MINNGKKPLHSSHGRIAPLVTTNPVTGATRFVTNDLIREAYLTPEPVDWDLAKHLEGKNAPWTESFSTAREETTRAVEAGLTSVARATKFLDPDEIDVSPLEEGRAKVHLTALKQLWLDLGRLPEPLATWSHVVACSSTDALEPLPILDSTPCPFADPAEGKLAATLERHHGKAPEKSLNTWRKRQTPTEPTAPGTLGHIQRALGSSANKLPRDKTISCFGLRDPREEAQFAAAHAQRMLDDQIVDQPQDIGLLVPDDATYALALQEACDQLGLPLSGGPQVHAARDLTGELLSLLLILLSAPAPRTALASLFISPLMIWSRDVGQRMARETMDYGWSRTASELEGPAREVFEALQPCHTPEQLFARLGVIASALPTGELHPRIAPLRAVTKDVLDWPLLHKLTAPQIIPASGHDRFVEGISLFTEASVPWRPVRQLIALGLTGRHWPRLPGSDPFFTEAEVALIRNETGLKLKGRREKLARGMELFRRQLCAATEGLTLLAPAMDLRGERLSPSIGLALVSNMLGAEKPADLVQNVRSLPRETWPVSHHLADVLPNGGTPVLPKDGILHLNRGLGTPDKPGLDLLRLRQDEKGHTAPQSPSRLETLLVSPLAWLLEELGAKDRTWAPEALDVMTLGTIIHQVLEDAFPENSAVASTGELQDKIPDILTSAIARHARWLSGPSWATERQTLLREAQDVARTWSGFLKAAGADVLHNEVTLSGDHIGLVLHGKADCLLRLPDGRILVVDHKRSSAGNRRDRMSKGWDLQVALYRAMLERPSEETALTRLVEDGAQIVTAYHTTRDASVLSDPSGVGLPRVEAAQSDVSSEAMAFLAATVAEVGAGTVRLNREGDAKQFEKERGIKAYALEENPLVAAFTVFEEDPA